MCYHYSIAKTADQIAASYGIALKPGAINPEPLFYHANGFNFSSLPVVSQDYNKSELNLEFMNWGMIPGWTKGEEQASKIRGLTLNARSETIDSKPSFRSSFRYRPCLLPASGYFEWMHYKGRKYPFYIYLPGSPLFSIAGLWDQWVNEQSGEIVRTFSVVTCEANSFAAKIHNTKKRMPVILEPDYEETWLDIKAGKQERQTILKSIEPGKMDAYTVSRLITSRENDSNVPEVLDKYIYNELSLPL